MSQLEEAVSAAAKGVAELRSQIDKLTDHNNELTTEKNFLLGRNEELTIENNRLRDKCDYYMRWNTELTINCTNAANIAKSLIITIEDGMNKARLAVANGKGHISDTEALKAVAKSIEDEIKPVNLPDAPKSIPPGIEGDHNIGKFFDPHNIHRQRSQS